MKALKYIDPHLQCIPIAQLVPRQTNYHCFHILVPPFFAINGIFSDTSNPTIICYIQVGKHLAL